ncbi:MAG: twin-arginine translocation signal domain-containing protein [Pseudooceanicola sp.]
MKSPFYNRRSFLVTAGLTGAALAQGPSGLVSAARANGFAPTQTMRGGANNYRPGAPLVDRLGSGFWVTGRVRRAGDGAPLEGVRIQIWAATTLGGEREPKNHGSVLTAADGTFRLETEQIVPNFGQPHAHLAYDDGAFETVFLRPVMPSASDTSVSADFVLAPA